MTFKAYSRIMAMNAEWFIFAHLLNFSPANFVSLDTQVETRRVTTVFTLTLPLCSFD